MNASSNHVRPLPPLSLRQLQYFVTVARTGSFTETAERVAVTQPALSTAIRQMENLLGGPVFDRATHPVTLTDLGRTILPLAEHLLETADTTFSSMKDSARLSQQIVRLSLLPAAAGRVIPLLEKVTHAVPAIRYEIRDVIHPDLATDVLTGASDIGIGVPCDDPRLEEKQLFTDTLAVVMRADDPLARESCVPWSRISERKIAMFQRGDIADWLGKLAEAQKLPYVEAAYRAEYVETLWELVRAGMALSVMPLMYQDLLFDSQLTFRPLMDPAITRRIVALRRLPVVSSAAVDVSFETLCAALAASAVTSTRR